MDRLNLEPLRFEILANQPAELDIIVNDKNSIHTGHTVGGGGPLAPSVSIRLPLLKHLYKTLAVQRSSRSFDRGQFLNVEPPLRPRAQVVDSRQNSKPGKEFAAFTPN
jgi:hypothetical protein